MIDTIIIIEIVISIVTIIIIKIVINIVTIIIIKIDINIVTIIIIEIVIIMFSKLFYWSKTVFFLIFLKQVNTVPIKVFILHG